MLPNEVDTHSDAVKRYISSSGEKVDKIKTVEAKDSKIDEEKWFFQRYKLIYWKIALQASITLTSLYSIYNYPFLTHYKTSIWGKYEVSR